MRVDLEAREFDWEFVPGMRTRAWGFGAQVPGPTIEAVEGDRVRIFVTNRLPEHTTIHWHGMILPNEMDGVSPITQDMVNSGDTYTYRFAVTEPAIGMYLAARPINCKMLVVAARPEEVVNNRPLARVL